MNTKGDSADDNRKADVNDILLQGLEIIRKELRRDEKIQNRVTILIMGIVIAGVVLFIGAYKFGWLRV